MDKKFFSKTNLRSKNNSTQFGPKNCKNKRIFNRFYKKY